MVPDRLPQIAHQFPGFSYDSFDGAAVFHKQPFPPIALLITRL